MPWVCQWWYIAGSKLKKFENTVETHSFKHNHTIITCRPEMVEKEWHQRKTIDGSYFPADAFFFETKS